MLIMTSFEFSLSTAERFVDAAAAVCNEARRLGARDTTVVLLFDGGPIAVSIDDAIDMSDDHRKLALSAQAFESSPAFQSLRERLAPCAFDTSFVAPLVGHRGWFGAIVCRTLGPLSHQFERDFAMLATHLSVWCTDRGVGAVPKRPANMQRGPRQHQIAELAAHGHTNDEIATMLGISVNTVKGRLKEVFEVLEVRNRTELVHVLRLLAPREEVPRGITKLASVTVTRAS